MIIPNDDVILYSIHILESNEDLSEGISKEVFADTLSITEGSLNIYLSRLSNKGMIERKKVHHERIISRLVLVSQNGLKNIERIESVLEELEFTPERHKISTNIRFLDLMKKVTYPLEKIFLLSLFTRKFSFNLNDFLGNIKSISDDTSIIGYFRELEKRNDQRPLKPFNIDIYNMSLYGEKPGYDSFISQDLREEDVNSLLISGETFRKQGRLLEASKIYELILKSDLNISQNQWFITNLGKAQVLRRQGKIDEAFNQLGAIKRNTKNKLYNALLNHTIAMYKGFNGDYEKKITILSSCIRSFQNFQIPLFLSLSLNSRGVAYYSLEKMKLAEKDWKSARKHSKLAGSPYAEAYVLTNLASLEAIKGNIKLGKKERNLKILE
jgi:tetratricopeptide (TPR) repeat protein